MVVLICSCVSEGVARTVLSDGLAVRDVNRTANHCAQGFPIITGEHEENKVD